MYAVTEKFGMPTNLAYPRAAAQPGHLPMSRRVAGLGRVVGGEEHGVELQARAVLPLDARAGPRLVDGELGLEVADGVLAGVARQ